MTKVNAHGKRQSINSANPLYDSANQPKADVAFFATRADCSPSFGPIQQTTSIADRVPKGLVEARRSVPSHFKLDALRMSQLEEVYMLRQSLAAFAFAVTTYPSLANEIQYNDPRAAITPDSFEDVSVRIGDDARNGCWTNLREVKTYAEDKLALKGFTVVEHDETTRRLSPVRAVLNVGVLSSRSREGGCFGVIQVDLMSTLNWNNYLSVNGSVGAGSSRIFSKAKNANILVLEDVDRFIQGWPAGIN